MSLRTPFLAFAAGVAILFTGVTAFTQDKQGPNTQDAPKNATDNAQCKAVQDLELAGRLIAFGRKEKNAESLLLAAQILHKTPTMDLKSGSKVDGPKGDIKANNPMWGKPADLVNEAKKMSSNAYVAAMATATEKMIQEATRGAVGGAKVDAFTISPGQSIRWNPIDFRANEKAVVFVDVGVNSRMTLEVIDQNGVVVARDNVPGDYYSCVWYPKWQGPFTFRLINQDSISFNCGMATN